MSFSTRGNQYVIDYHRENRKFNLPRCPQLTTWGFVSVNLESHVTPRTSPLEILQVFTPRAGGNKSIKIRKEQFRIID